MPRAPRLPARWPELLAAAVVALGVIAALAIPSRARLAGTVAALILMAIHARSDDDRLAWWWGLLLPIDFIKSVPSEVLDVARYGGLVWMCWRIRPDISPARKGYVVTFASLVGAVAIIRGVGSVARSDNFGMFIAAAMLLGAMTAPFVAVRVRTHRTILAGFIAGVGVSAVVSLMQSLELPTLQDGNTAGSRFPGLASTTMLITWHLAFALIIAVYFLVAQGHRRRDRITAMAVVPIAVVALVVNGAQGGLLGLGAAGLAVAVFGWRDLAWKSLGRYVVGAAVLVAAVGALMLATNVNTPTIDGLRGKGDYRNEIARWDVAKAGFDELVAHPLAGVGRTNFEDSHGDGLAPHFLPLEAGVTSGVVGFAVASTLLGFLLSVIVRGPVGRRPEAWLGLALAAAMFANSLIETGGPFTGLPRFSLLLIAVIACRGETWPPSTDRLDVKSQQVPVA